MDKEWQEIWQQSSDSLPSPSVEIDLTKKPLNLVQKLERSIRWENKFNYFFVIVFLPWLLYTKHYLGSIALLGLMIPTFYYYHQLIKKLSGTIVDEDVRSYLKKSYQILRTFMNHYKAAGWVLGSVGLVIGVTYNSEEDLLSLLSKPKFLISFGIAAVLTISLIYVLIYFIYGRKFRKLEELVKSIEDS